MMDTKAAAPSARGGGSSSNFSIAGKLTSTTLRPVLRNCAIICGRRCRVCGPNTRSTHGARFTIVPASWLATQPPTPMTTCGRAALMARHSPSREYTLSSAFSRTEQVFMMRTSASAAVSVGTMPALLCRTSAMRAESYSFIWQPNVLMK